MEVEKMLSGSVGNTVSMIIMLVFYIGLAIVISVGVAKLMRLPKQNIKPIAVVAALIGLIVWLNTFVF